MGEEITITYPGRTSLGSVYLAERNFPHRRSWIGEASGSSSYKLPADKMLGLALGSIDLDSTLGSAGKILASFQSLDLSMSRFTQQTFQLLVKSGLEAIVELRLDYLPIKDKDMEGIKFFSNLQTLWLTGTEVAADGLKPLSQLTSLKELVLKDTPVNESGLKEVAAIKSLTGITLPKQTSDKGLAEIKALPALQRLDISNCQVTDQGMSELSQIKTLTELSVSDTTVGDAGLATLASMPSLKILHLCGTKVTDSGLNALDNSRLEHLDLRDSKATEIGIARLRTKLPDCAIFGP